MEVPVPQQGVGVLLWDKPAGQTSHDVVEEIRRATGMKAGHVGTLDPFATGLLVILLGRATRLQRYLVGLPKGYLATARYGWTSTTGDPDGHLEETGRLPADLDIPTGTFEQTVPMTSAVKVGGERLYRKAHRGETVGERPTREVTVLESTLGTVEKTASGVPVRGQYELVVSSGTYVRTLITDLGDAYCEELRRISVGPFSIDQAGTLLSPIEALPHLPRAELEGDEPRACANGVSIDDRWDIAKGDAALLVDGNELIGVARRNGEGLRPEVVLRPAAG